jgi:hypothetical protein
MKKKQIWMALVTDENEVVFSKACQTEKKAEKAIVEYLRKDQEFDGRDFSEACFWIGEKDLRLELMVFPMEPDEFKDVNPVPLSIDLPPDEKGLYRVVYAIDVGAGNITEAAINAYEMMSDSDSLPPVLEVIDNKNNRIKIDLSERKKKGRIHGK